MGVLPLQFLPGENAASLGLTGEETFDVLGVQDRHATAAGPCQGDAAKWRCRRVRRDRAHRQSGRSRILPQRRHSADGPAAADTVRPPKGSRVDDRYHDVNDRRRVSVPREADTVVIGGGTAGAVVAGLLAEQSDERVVVLEAGPDYGPFGDGRWPAGSPRRASARLHPRLELRLRRYLPQPGRQLRAGQSHWGMLVAQRLRRDLGQPGRLRRLGGDGVSPAGRPRSCFRSSHVPPTRLRVRRYARHEVTPFQQACLDAAPGAGIPAHR